MCDWGDYFLGKRPNAVGVVVKKYTAARIFNSFVKSPSLVLRIEANNWLPMVLSEYIDKGVFGD